MTRDSGGDATTVDSGGDTGLKDGPGAESAFDLNNEPDIKIPDAPLPTCTDGKNVRHHRQLQRHRLRRRGRHRVAELRKHQFKGDIAEIIVYASALGATARKSVEAYLNAKYKVH